MESRHLRKGRVECAADKWLDERKVDIGVIFESWKSLRKKRSDTDPGLAFHLMEIHDRYCFCRFEESQSTFREDDMIVSSDMSESTEHSEQVDENVDRNVQETASFSHRHPAGKQSEDINQKFSLYKQNPSSKTQTVVNFSAQHSRSKVETVGKPCCILKDSSCPTNTETYMKETRPPPLEEHILLPPKRDVSPVDYAHSGYAGTVSVSTQPGHVLGSAGVSQQLADPSHRLGDGGVCVKTEPVAIDLEPGQSEDTAQTGRIPLATGGDQTPKHPSSLQTQQTATDRLLCASSPSAMSEDFKLLIIQKIIERGGDINSGLVPHGTFSVVGSHVGVPSRMVEDLWYKFVFSRSVSTHSRVRSGVKKKISTAELEFIAELRTGNPAITEREIKQRLKQDLNVEVSQPTINRAIRQQLMIVRCNRKRWQVHK